MKVRLSPRAERDLDRIHSFIATESKDEVVATTFVLRLLDTCSTLRSFPLRYPVHLSAPKWRVMPYQKYMIFFEVRANEIRIGHIRHSARRPLRD